MKKITCAQVHQALVDSIELRWKPISQGYLCVHDCQLCELFRAESWHSNRCKGCPLYLIGHHCKNKNSAYFKWTEDCVYYSKRRKAAINMLKVLQQAKDKFFPKGWDK